MALDYLRESIVKPIKELEGKYLLEVFLGEKASPVVTRHIVSELILRSVTESISEVYGANCMKAYKIAAIPETLPDGSITVKPSLEDFDLSKLPEEKVLVLKEYQKKALNKVKANIKANLIF